MESLAEVLESFNRKERNHLIRKALGQQRTARHLCRFFLEEIRTKIKLNEPIPSDTWWATDYHIDWLFGALAVFYEGKANLTKIWPNEAKMIKGSQQDFDLIIAFDQTVILIEAKAYMKSDGSQIRDKSNRLKSLEQFNTALQPDTSRRVRICPLYMSPTQPAEDIHWIQWSLPTNRRQVQRCTEKGTSSEDGGYWQIVPRPQSP